MTNKPRICPHCGKEITEQDLRNTALYDVALYGEFCESETGKILSNKERSYFFGGVALLMTVLFGGLFLKPSVNLLLFFLCGSVLGIVAFITSFYYQAEKNRLFEKFKKSRTAQ